MDEDDWDFDDEDYYDDEWDDEPEEYDPAEWGFVVNEEGEKGMLIQQLNPYGACSSVIIRDVATSSREEAIKRLRQVLDLKVPGTCTLQEGHTLAETEYFAYVCISVTDNINYESTVKVLEEIGMKTDGYQHNAKNQTNCALYIMRTGEFRKKVIELFEGLSK